MRIIISPAKKMQVNTDDFAIKGLPVFIKQSEKLMHYMQGLSFEECKNLWKCSDRLVQENRELLKKMDLYHQLTPAILSYSGLAFQYMAPDVFTYDALNYIQKHLRILSGFYGVLAPFDGVTPYRLEMKAKIGINDTHSLYDFWDYHLYSKVIDDDHLIINLASREYAKCISDFLQEDDTMIDIIFGELIGQKVKVKGTIAKMARGEMVRYLAENNIQSPDDIKSFHELKFHFNKALSNEHQYVFIK